MEEKNSLSGPFKALIKTEIFNLLFSQWKKNSEVREIGKQSVLP
jgi:hypothetical protein